MGRAGSPAVALIVAFVVVAVTGCGSATGSSRNTARGTCPTDPVSVVVSVDQWGDIVGRLGGDCARVTTVITGTSANPHDYEPTPGDTATFASADLVVFNGLGYDPFAAKAVAALDNKPAVIDAGRVVGLSGGDNPHIWYSPDDVRRVSAAVTARLRQLAPKAARYFDRRQTGWQRSMKPYDDEIVRIKAMTTSKTYGATEPIFAYMANAVGLTPATPPGYQNAASNGSDPAPADVARFEQLLRDKRISLLVDNTQTQGAIPDQIRGIADDAGIPVVEVTETIPPGTDSFVEWQVDQLRSLARAVRS